MGDTRENTRRAWLIFMLEHRRKSQASRAHVSGAALDLEPWPPRPPPPSPGLLEAELSCEPADCHENCPTASHASCR